MSEPDDRDDAIGTEASHWFATMRGPDADAERFAFETWRDSDPRHARAYAEVEALFAVAQGARRTPPQPAPTVQQQHSAPPSRVAGARRLVRPVGIAAALAATIALGSIAFTSGNRPAGPDRTGPLAVEGGPPHLQRFGDGTLVLLGAASLVTANLDDVVHQLKIESGRARFYIAASPEPVLILANGHHVTARDAIVDVAIDGEGVHVTAIAGSVDVAGDASDAPQPLRAGQMMLLGHEVGEPVTAPQSASDWLPARLSFDATPLADVAAVANGFGGKPLRFTPDALGRAGLTGTFDVRDTAALSRKIAAALALRVSEDKDAITLHRP